MIGLCAERNDEHWTVENIGINLKTPQLPNSATVGKFQNRGIFATPGLAPMAKREILKLGNRFYTVRRHENLGDRGGEWDGDAGYIEILAGQPNDAELEILVHELFHAAWHNADLPGRTTEEKAVSILARAAVEAFARNPTLRTRLKKLVDNDK